MLAQGADRSDSGRPSARLLWVLHVPAYVAPALIALLQQDARSVEFWAVSAALAAALVALSVVDIRTLTLPDTITLPMIAAGLLIAAYWSPEFLLLHVGAAAVGYLVLWLIAIAYQRLRGRAGLGVGDIKLYSASGAWMGPWALPAVLLVATLGALFATLVKFLRTRRIEATERIAFGPYLALAFWLVWLYAA